MQSHYGKRVARGGEGASIAARMSSAGMDMSTRDTEVVAIPELTAAGVSTTADVMPASAPTPVQARASTPVADIAKASSAAPSQPSDPTYYAAGDLDVFPRALVKPDLNAALAADPRIGRGQGARNGAD